MSKEPRLKRLSPSGDDWFIALAPYDFIPKGTLIWAEETHPISNENVVLGPFILTTEWCNSLFGERMVKSYRPRPTVTCLDPETGVEERIVHATLLYRTYFVHMEDYQ